jgi:hypothetical protein
MEQDSSAECQPVTSQVLKRFAHLMRGQLSVWNQDSTFSSLIQELIMSDKHQSKKFLLGEGVGGAKKDASGCFRLGDNGFKFWFPDTGSPTSWACRIAICFRISAFPVF